MAVVDEMRALLEAGPQGPTGYIQFGEVYHVVAEFECTTGTNESVVVRLLDGGPNFHVPECRYVVHAHVAGEPGRTAAGNGGATPELALASVHWHGLDREESLEPRPTPRWPPPTKLAILE